VRSAVKALGEVALRVNDLDGMQRFYEEVVGLEFVRRIGDIAFLRIADGFEGHTAVLALFRQEGPVAQPGGTLHHMAFTISRDDFAPEMARLEGLGLRVTTMYHDWVSWRSMYVNDPEGNEVELVCYDPA